jgi:hypothetical protein
MRGRSPIKQMDTVTLEFRFEPRWKEELVVHHDGGSFVLDFPMGRPNVCLPTEPRWRSIAPPSLADHWAELHTQMKAWCESNNFPLTVNENETAYWD